MSSEERAGVQGRQLKPRVDTNIDVDPGVSKAVAELRAALRDHARKAQGDADDPRTKGFGFNEGCPACQDDLYESGKPCGVCGHLGRNEEASNRVEEYTPGLSPCSVCGEKRWEDKSATAGLRSIGVNTRATVCNTCDSKLALHPCGCDLWLDAAGRGSEYYSPAHIPCDEHPKCGVAFSNRVGVIARPDRQVYKDPKVKPDVKKSYAPLYVAHQAWVHGEVKSRFREGLVSAAIRGVSQHPGSHAKMGHHDDEGLGEYLGFHLANRLGHGREVVHRGHLRDHVRDILGIGKDPDPRFSRDELHPLAESVTDEVHRYLQGNPGVSKAWKSSCCGAPLEMVPARWAQSDDYVLACSQCGQTEDFEQRLPRPHKHVHLRMAHEQVRKAEELRGDLGEFTGKATRCKGRGCKNYVVAQPRNDLCERCAADGEKGGGVREKSADVGARLDAIAKRRDWDEREKREEFIRFGSVKNIPRHATMANEWITYEIADHHELEPEEFNGAVESALQTMDDDPIGPPRTGIWLHDTLKQRHGCKGGPNCRLPEDSPGHQAAYDDLARAYGAYRDYETDPKHKAAPAERLDALLAGDRLAKAPEVPPEVAGAREALEGLRKASANDELPQHDIGPLGDLDDEVGALKQPKKPPPKKRQAVRMAWAWTADGKMEQVPYKAKGDPVMPSQWWQGACPEGCGYTTSASTARGLPASKLTRHVERKHPEFVKRHTRRERGYGDSTTYHTYTSPNLYKPLKEHHVREVAKPEGAKEYAFQCLCRKQPYRYHSSRTLAMGRGSWMGEVTCPRCMLDGRTATYEVGQEAEHEQKLRRLERDFKTPCKACGRPKKHFKESIYCWSCNNGNPRPCHGCGSHFTPGGAVWTCPSCGVSGQSRTKHEGIQALHYHHYYDDLPNMVRDKGGYCKNPIPGMTPHSKMRMLNLSRYEQEEIGDRDQAILQPHVREKESTHTHCEKCHLRDRNKKAFTSIAAHGLDFGGDGF